MDQAAAVEPPLPFQSPVQAVMIDAQRALVRPRILAPHVAGPVLLEDEVLTRLEEGPGLIELFGPAGSGKSAAIAHLASLFGDRTFLTLVDGAGAKSVAELQETAKFRLVVFTRDGATRAASEADPWRMASWTREDCIEYLLAAHHKQCADVMRRVMADRQWSWLGGSPALCRPVLDHLARDTTLTDARSALWHELQLRLGTPEMRLAAGEYCAGLLAKSPSLPVAAAKLWKSGSLEQEIRSLLKHAQVQTLLAAEHLAERLKSSAAADVLQSKLLSLLVGETAALLRNNEQVLLRLKDFATGRDRNCHSMAVSLLYAAGSLWRPDQQPGLSLKCAQLAGVTWPRIRVKQLDLSLADLTEADLTEVDLQDVSAYRVRLGNARLHGASLVNLRAYEAQLSDVDLSFVRAPEAQLRFAVLRDAHLEGAWLLKGDFEGADLRGARFCRASLQHARFLAVQLDDADFTGADLSYAELIGLILRVANFAGARFSTAQLLNCDLEGMVLPGADFECADWTRSHLTGSQMPNANFRSANLRDTGLAEIEWERENLRDADLRGSTFHMGSSRSGLVGSPLACEGSRTGFYTDEYHEQDFKSPEEIRKANLCGADLRGARIDNVDFYLVDLRGAQYTPDQAEHFRSCGAILETRV